MGPKSQAIANECACAHTFAYMDMHLHRAFFEGKREEGNVGDLSA